jgi:hypothetical protein
MLTRISNFLRRGFGVYLYLETPEHLPILQK